MKKKVSAKKRKAGKSKTKVGVLPDGIEVLPAEDTGPVTTGPEPRAAKKEVVPYDPLRAYMREMSRYPKLSPEEEKELAVKYQSNKDLKAAYKLLSSNLWLVVKIARDYRRTANNMLDLIQEGNIGLMDAVKNYDPYRGVRFPSYAVWWVKAYMVRYLIANWRMVKIGTTQAQRKLFFNLQKEKEKLEREGFYPSPKLLAEKLDVKEKEVIEMDQRLGSSDLSVDAPVSAETQGTLLSILPSEEASAEDLVAKKQMKDLLFQALEEFSETLNYKEEQVFKRRMLSEQKETLRELSEDLSLSRERIRQIENAVKDRLKDFVLEKFGSEFTQLEDLWQG